MERNEKRVLVVDDDNAIRALLFAVLRRRGYKVDVARNGAEALQRCSACLYSVILMDLMMPTMSGYEFLETIEREWTMQERPLVIVLTAGNEPRNLNPKFVAGSIRKPFDVEMLLDTVSACLHARGPQPQPESCPEAESEQAMRNREPC
jgi:two-component system phosphate regulon response regulator PhoB